MPILVEYVEKEKIYPRFGLWRRCGEVAIISVRQDLPDCMRDFIVDHELAHERDKLAGDYENDGWIENEREASWPAFLQHPVGALLTILWSLAPYRLKYYWQRFRTGGSSGESA